MTHLQQPTKNIKLTPIMSDAERRAAIMAMDLDEILSQPTPLELENKLTIDTKEV